MRRGRDSNSNQKLHFLRHLLIKGITVDYWIIGGLEIGGTLSLFTGDRFIQRLEQFVFGKILFEKKNDQSIMSLEQKDTLSYMLSFSAVTVALTLNEVLTTLILFLPSRIGYGYLKGRRDLKDKDNDCKL